MANIITERQKEVLRFIKQAFLNNDEEIIKQVNQITGTPNIIKLKSELLKAFNKLGDTPIKEPKLLALKETNEDTIFDDMNVVFEVTGINPDDYEIGEISDFVKECFQKVNSEKDENGKYKKTDLTKDAKLPKWSDLKSINKILKPIGELLQEEAKKARATLAGFDPDIDDEEELEIALNELKKHYEKERKPLEVKKWKMVEKITGVKIADLTEWEKDLLFNANIMSYINKELNTPS